MNIDTSCSRCDLAAGCDNVCVPMYPLHKNGKDRAVLFVINSPDSIQEGYLRMIYAATAEERGDDRSLAERADCYVTFAVRCKVPPKVTITQGKQNACRPYLVREINELLARYEEVVIVCCGGAASKTVSGLAQRAGYKAQGDPIDRLPDQTKKDEWQSNGLDRSCRVFHTVTPKALVPGIDPSAIDYVSRHIGYITDYLDGQVDMEASEVKPPPMGLIFDDGVQTLDIESYGFLAGAPDQNHFHPRKCEHWDGPTRQEAIATCAITAETGVSGYNWSDPAHCRAVCESLATLKANGGYLQGMNLPFDVPMLRHFFPPLRKILDYPLRLRDLMIRNYLYQEDRPEKNLKNLSPLYGVTRYEKTERSYSQSDPRFYAYNAQDTDATHSLIPKIEAEIAGYYPDTVKCTEESDQWFSDLLWGCIWMKEAGSAIDVPAMEALDRRLLAEMEALGAEYKERFGEPLYGKGSQAGIQDLFINAVEQADLTSHRDLVKTRTELISTGKDNIQLIEQHIHKLPPDLADRIHILVKLRKAQKIRGTYTQPMLTGSPKKNGEKKKEACQHINGIVYPEWYPVRAEAEDGRDGGTVQARVTCKNPALPTSPPLVQACYGTRWCPGFRLHSDYGQLEWRIAALLSGDPVMIEEIEQGIDAHQRTCIDCFGEEMLALPDFKIKWRQAAKMTNFGILFWATPWTVMTQLRKQFGIEVTIEEAKGYIDAIYGRYRVLGMWQHNLVKQALAQGYLEVPFTGHSRRFRGKEFAVIKTYSNVIVNMLVQACAACVLQSARFQTQLAMRGMPAAVVLDVYDAMDVEGRLDHLEWAKRTVKHKMETSPYLLRLFDLYGRQVPMSVDQEVVCIRTDLRKDLDRPRESCYIGSRWGDGIPEVATSK